MVFNRFFFKLLFRTILILGNLMILAWMFLREDLFFTQVTLVAVLFAQLGELTLFINRTNQDLTRFMEAVKARDFTISFNQSGNIRSLSALHHSFNQLTETFKELETANAAQFHFLNRLVDQIEFGIISFDECGDITLINQQAQSQLELPAINQWRNLQNPNTRFLQTLLDLPIAQNQLVETKLGDQQRYFSVSITAISIQGKIYRISSFQDIKSEIQGKEIEAWHKLIRILTHEIMNSVTPMISLTDTIQVILQDQEKKNKPLAEITEENISDINEALSTIRERSEGILKFVDNYRKLTKVPTPEFSRVPVSQLISNVLRLMDAPLAKSGVKIHVSTSEVLLSLDQSLITQVLINLIKNSIEALSNTREPGISIYAQTSGEFYRISVSDNGPGIPSDKVEKIFIPFFTTKSDGSGIGLSLSRQIMNLHGGYLELTEASEKETVFSLMFPVRLLPTSVSSLTSMQE